MNTGQEQIEEHQQSAFLTETLQENFTPTQNEIVEKSLEMGIAPEEKYLELVRKCLVTPLPPHYRPFKTSKNQYYYLNEKTGQCTSEHPIDIYFKNQYEQMKGLKKTKFTHYKLEEISKNLYEQWIAEKKMSTILEDQEEKEFSSLKSLSPQVQTWSSHELARQISNHQSSEQLVQLQKEKIEEMLILQFQGNYQKQIRIARQRLQSQNQQYINGLREEHHNQIELQKHEQKKELAKIKKKRTGHLKQSHEQTISQKQIDKSVKEIIQKELEQYASRKKLYLQKFRNFCAEDLERIKAQQFKKEFIKEHFSIRLRKQTNYIIDKAKLQFLKKQDSLIDQQLKKLKPELKNYKLTYLSILKEKAKKLSLKQQALLKDLRLLKMKRQMKQLKQNIQPNKYIRKKVSQQSDQLRDKTKYFNLQLFVKHKKKIFSAYQEMEKLNYNRTKKILTQVSHIKRQYYDQKFQEYNICLKRENRSSKKSISSIAAIVKPTNYRNAIQNILITNPSERRLSLYFSKKYK